MTRRLPRRVVQLLAATALVVPLAACSGGGDADDVQAFCDSGEEAFAEVDATGSLSDDPEAFAQQVSDLHEGFDSMDPPADIADDWEVFTQAFGDLDAALQDIDPTDTEAFNQALTDFSEQASSDELTTASDNIGTYLTDNCEA